MTDNPNYENQNLFLDLGSFRYKIQFVQMQVNKNI